jgi:hypothetical protein
MNALEKNKESTIVDHAIKIVNNEPLPFCHSPLKSNEGAK